MQHRTGVPRETKGRISDALWALTELEAAALAMLELLELAREAMRRAIEEGGSST